MLVTEIVPSSEHAMRWPPESIETPPFYRPRDIPGYFIFLATEYAMKREEIGDPSWLSITHTG